VADRRKYTKEFKENALELAGRGDKSIAEVACELGIKAELIYRWRARAAKAEAEGTKAFPGHGNPRDEELARLRKENAELREINEILKKATAIFAARNPR
jgi:transposase-like protein